MKVFVLFRLCTSVCKPLWLCSKSDPLHGVLKPSHEPFCLHLVNSETVVTWWSPLCQPEKFDLGLIFTLSVVVGLSAVYTFLLLLCPHVDLFLTFLSFFPAGRRDCDLFGLCEERLSSVWVFLSLPAVYATHAVPGGAWSVGHCWAGKQTRWHTLHHIVC